MDGTLRVTRPTSTAVRAVSASRRHRNLLTQSESLFMHIAHTAHTIYIMHARFTLCKKTVGCLLSSVESSIVFLALSCCSCKLPPTAVPPTRTRWRFSYVTRAPILSRSIIHFGYCYTAVRTYSSTYDMIVRTAVLLSMVSDLTAAAVTGFFWQNFPMHEGLRTLYVKVDTHLLLAYL